MKNLKNKRGISLIVLVITIIVMIILAAAIILSISNGGIMDKANKAKQDSDVANLKEYVNVLQAEWELMSESERTGTIKSYIETQIDKKGISLDGYYITETGEIITDSIIAYVEYLKEQKGSMENWDDITVVLNENSPYTFEATGTYSQKGFEFEYAGKQYTYIYGESGVDNNGLFIFRFEPLGGLVSYRGHSAYEAVSYSENVVVEVPEGVIEISGGNYCDVTAVIFPESLTQISGGTFYYGATRLKEMKINGTLTSITGCGIEESDCDFPEDCRIFYQDKEMTVNEFTKLFQ